MPRGRKDGSGFAGDKLGAFCSAQDGAEQSSTGGIDAAVCPMKAGCGGGNTALWEPSFVLEDRGRNLGGTEGRESQGRHVGSVGLETGYLAHCPYHGYSWQPPVKVAFPDGLAWSAGWALSLAS